MTNTRPIPNLSAAIGEAKSGGQTIAKVFLISPFLQFFQQFVQLAPAVVNVTVGASPFEYTPNQIGTIIITGGTVSNISLIRGQDIINLTGEKVIPISIGDSVSVTYSVLPTIQFLGA